MRKSIRNGLVFALLAIFVMVPVPVFAEVIVGPFAEDILDDQTYTGQEYDYQAKALRGSAPRGGYRSSPGTYRGGTGVGGGTTTGGGGTTSGTAPGGTAGTGGTGTGAGYTTGGGTRTGVGTGVGAGVGAGTRTGVGTTTGTGRWGSFFGGMAAGAVLGHLFNPFGWGGLGYGAGYGGGFLPIVSILVWGVLIYLTYRIVKWLFRGRVR